MGLGPAVLLNSDTGGYWVYQVPDPTAVVWDPVTQSYIVWTQYVQ